MILFSKRCMKDSNLSLLESNLGSLYVCGELPTYLSPKTTLGTSRYKDGDGRQNITEKVNLHSFNLHRNYFKSLTLSNVDEPP